MRMLLVAVALMAVVGLAVYTGAGVMAFQSGQALSPEGNVSKCEQVFKNLDSGGKGYLTYNDFRAGDGLGKHKGYGQIGGTHSAFMSADTKGDGHLTMGEFCAWKNRS